MSSFDFFRLASQEASENAVGTFASYGITLLSDPSMGRNVWNPKTKSYDFSPLDCCVGAKTDLIRSSRILGGRFELQPNECSWQLKCLYGEFELKHEYGAGEFLDTLRIGSCHLHNVRAKCYDIAIAQCKLILQDAAEYSLDLLGVDLNGAASTHCRHLEEDSSFIAAMRDHMGDAFFTQPSALMGLMDKDCTALIVPRLPQSKVFALVVLSS